MTSPATPSSPKPAGDDRKLVSVDENYIAPTFEDRMHLFWQKNGTAVLVVIGLIVVGIVGWGGYGYLQRQKEREIEDAFAAAKTSEQLKAFAAAHPEHTLAGIGYLTIADEAYAAGKAADAMAAYEKVVSLLKTGPLVARAKIGIAVTKAQAGKAAEATAELKQIAADTTQPKGVRGEASYQLASLASEAGNGAEAQKYLDQLNQIDPNSRMTQRAMMLRISLPPAPPAAAPATPDAAPGAVQVKIPGK
jgi:hypothetical protein